MEFTTLKANNGNYTLGHQDLEGVVTLKFTELTLHGFLAQNNTNITLRDEITAVTLRNKNTLEVIAYDPEGFKWVEEIYADDEFLIDFIDA